MQPGPRRFPLPRQRDDLLGLGKRLPCPLQSGSGSLDIEIGSQHSISSLLALPLQKIRGHLPGGRGPLLAIIYGGIEQGLGHAQAGFEVVAVRRIVVGVRRRTQFQLLLIEVDEKAAGRFVGRVILLAQGQAWQITTGTGEVGCIFGRNIRPCSQQQGVLAKRGLQGLTKGRLCHVGGHEHRRTNHEKREYD